MLHQTLISSPFSFSSPSSSLLHLPYSHSSQVEKERKMEAFVNNQQQGFDGGDDVYCVVGGGDDFSVDDFINFETEDEDQIQEKEKDEEEEEEDEAENSNSSSVISFEPPPVSELSLPAHDVAELEWVSRIMDDSLSEFPATYEAAPKIGTQDRTHQSPPPVPVKAKRSKRTRTSSGSWAPLHLTDSTSSSTTTTTTSSTSSCSSPSYSSQLIFAHSVFDEIPLPAFKKQKPKKRGRKPKQPNQEPNNSSSNNGERRCSHCGVNKTPQWRTGPMGAKTLCNACGVRYKSGRLLPEYRPACSPTFISHVHSNSHRKVLEMRRKKEEEDKLVFSSAAPPVASF